MGRVYGLCAQIATAITWPLSLFGSLTLSLSFLRPLALSLTVSLFLSVHLLYSFFFFFHSQPASSAYLSYKRPTQTSFLQDGTPQHPLVTGISLCIFQF